MTNKKRSTLKNIFWVLTAIILMFGNGYLFSICNFFQNKNLIYAENNSSENVSITNGNFSQSTSSSYPKTVTSWTKCGLDNTNIVSGIIDVSTSVFTANKEKYKLPNELTQIYPVANSGDSNVLMINNHGDSAKYFYYTSSSISLEANAFFEISVWGKTESSTLGISVKNDSDTINLSYLSGTSAWKEFKFYVATSTIESSTISIELSLGKQTQKANGAVFFDYIKCNKISENQFLESTDQSVEANQDVQFVSLAETNGYVNRITNASFEDATSGWTVNKASANSSANSNISTSETHNNLSSNTHYLKIATNDVADNIKFESDTFTLKQQEILKLSFWAKASASANAKISVDSFTLNGEEISITKPEAVSQTISTTEDGTSTSGWTCYNFVLVGHSWCDTQLKLTFELGSESNSVEGFLYIDDIKTLQINRAQKEKCSSLNKVETLEVQNFSSSTVSNGFFNTAKEIEYDASNNVIYPLSPASWEISSTDNLETDDYVCGIINTNETVFDASNLVGITNPGRTPNQQYSSHNLNNLLVIKNNALSNLTVSSTELSFSSSSYYELSLCIKTQGGTASVELKSGNTIYAQKQNITSANWKKITLYVKTSTFGLNPSLSITQTNSNGAIFIDDVILETIDETEFSNNSSSINENDILVDLSLENFKINSNQYVGELISSTAANAEELVDAKIYDTTSEDYPEITALGSADGDNKILMIKSSDFVNYEFKSTNAFTVDSNSYHKVSVFCKVKNILGEDNSTNSLVGAKIALTNFEQSFSGIKNESNDWIEYSFFINPTNATTFNIVLSLGDENAKTSGFALFDKISFEKLTESEFDSEYNLAKARGSNVLKLQNIVEEEPTQEEPQNDTTKKTNFDWLWIPSLILGVALIIAIVGVSVKNIKIKPRAKSIKNDYDKENIAKKEARKEKRKKLVSFMTTEDENENTNEKNDKK